MNSLVADYGWKRYNAPSDCSLYKDDGRRINFDDDKQTMTLFSKNEGCLGKYSINTDNKLVMYFVFN